MFNNSNDNKVRRRNVSSNNSGTSNRVRRPDNSYDEERLRENTKSKPVFEKRLIMILKEEMKVNLLFQEKMEKDYSQEAEESKSIEETLEIIQMKIKNMTIVCFLQRERKEQEKMQILQLLK